MRFLVEIEDWFCVIFLILSKMHKANIFGHLNGFVAYL